MTVEQEKVQGMLKEKLREKGWKVTRQRLSILQTLAEHKGQHLAAEDIFELMKDEYPEMGLATVYRTLQLLYEIQLIDRIHFNDGCIRYEIGHIFDGDSKHSHHHLICRTCGRVMPFEDDFLEDLEAQIQAVGNAFAIDMLAAKFIQGLPVVGAFGGLSNPVCWKQVMTYVQLKYRKRYLMGKTG